MRLEYAGSSVLRGGRVLAIRKVKNEPLGLLFDQRASF
jgi:hypothetical protein